MAEDDFVHPSSCFERILDTVADLHLGSTTFRMFQLPKNKTEFKITSRQFAIRNVIDNNKPVAEAAVFQLQIVLSTRVGTFVMVDKRVIEWLRLNRLD